MRKLFLVAIIICTMFTAAVSAQDNSSSTTNDIPSKGRAPREPNGIGRLDLRVVDEQGNPIRGVRADLESRRTDGFLCESWNWTDERGVAVLPPLHMGRLTLKLKAPGYETQRVVVNSGSLDEPLRITMVRKK
ncbi:MAG TPA: carboxypeptidase-like regulatory domain-containing protein [Pyrinomonadaceae bacterium]|jgi:hypothetical protein